MAIKQVPHGGATLQTIALKQVQLGANQANCANSLKPHEHLLLKVPKVELDLCMR